MAHILTLKISLNNVKPRVTRTIQVPDTCTFEQLHNTIQDAMGWEDAHLFAFYDLDDNDIYNMNCIDTDDDDDDDTNTTMNQMIKNVVFPIIYMYDMGDSWEHRITLMKTANKKVASVYPIILKGACACPPEDIGGSWGFADMKAALLKDDPDGEFEDFHEYDPNEFDMANIKFRYIWDNGVYRKNV